MSTELLHRFFHEYMHQDWDLEYERPEDAFDDFLGQLGTADDRQRVHQELVSLASLEEDEFVVGVDEMTSGWTPTLAFGAEGARKWFRQLAEHPSLRSEVSGPSPPSPP